MSEKRLAISASVNELGEATVTFDNKDYLAHVTESKDILVVLGDDMTDSEFALVRAAARVVDEKE